MAQLDIFRLLLEQLLKIDPSLIAKYTTVQDQLLYLILIPHVILILFIFAFSAATVGRVIGPHKGIRYLVSIVVYLYVVWAGWYGTFLVPLLISWFWIALVMGLFIFFISIVVSPARATAGLKLAAQAGQMLGKKMKGKSDERSSLEQEIQELQNELASLQIPVPGETPMAASYRQMRIGAVQGEIAKKQTQLARL